MNRQIEIQQDSLIAALKKFKESNSASKNIKELVGLFCKQEIPAEIINTIQDKHDPMMQRFYGIRNELVHALRFDAQPINEHLMLTMDYVLSCLEYFQTQQIKDWQVFVLHDVLCVTIMHAKQNGAAFTLHTVLHAYMLFEWLGIDENALISTKLGFACNTVLHDVRMQDMQNKLEYYANSRHLGNVGAIDAALAQLVLMREEQVLFYAQHVAQAPKLALDEVKQEPRIVAENRSVQAPLPVATEKKSTDTSVQAEPASKSRKAQAVNVRTQDVLKLLQKIIQFKSSAGDVERLLLYSNYLLEHDHCVLSLAIRYVFTCFNHNDKLICILLGLSNEKIQSLDESKIKINRKDLDSSWFFRLLLATKEDVLSQIGVHKCTVMYENLLRFIMLAPSRGLHASLLHTLCSSSLYGMLRHNLPYVLSLEWRICLVSLLKPNLKQNDGDILQPDYASETIQEQKQFWQKKLADVAATKVLTREIAVDIFLTYPHNTEDIWRRLAACFGLQRYIIVESDAEYVEKCFLRMLDCSGGRYLAYFFEEATVEELSVVINERTLAYDNRYSMGTMSLIDAICLHMSSNAMLVFFKKHEHLLTEELVNRVNNYFSLFSKANPSMFLNFSGKGKEFLRHIKKFLQVMKPENLIECTSDAGIMPQQEYSFLAELVKHDCVGLLEEHPHLLAVIKDEFIKPKTFLHELSVGFIISAYAYGIKFLAKHQDWLEAVSFEVLQQPITNLGSVLTNMASYQEGIELLSARPQIVAKITKKILDAPILWSKSANGAKANATLRNYLVHGGVKGQHLLEKIEKSIAGHENSTKKSRNKLKIAEV